MKSPFAISLLVLLFTVNSSAQTSPTNTVQRPDDFEYFAVADSDGYSMPLKMPDIARANGQVLPYPIIFIHGLNSNCNIWNTPTDNMDSWYGLTYGGRYDFCLNYNSANTSTNTNFYPTANADICIFQGTWNVGDYYFVNFDVGNNGSFHPDGNANDVISNQQAITKQGKALQEAVYRVLQLTGRDKVILMGHSMGGLAAREYVQNSSNWQNDGLHHVAKLITTGTPHGGSNQVTGSSAFSGVDCQSEAYRDLRTSYSGSGASGVYLFGGTESNSVMDLTFCSSFYNTDVNCNGSTGNSITGLNQRNIYTNLDYACVIGRCTGCGGSAGSGDGIVTAYSANLKNFYSGLDVSAFDYNGSALAEIHTDLPSQDFQNMQGLDEPDKYNLAYEVALNTSYTGFVTQQATSNSHYPDDYDEFKFHINANGSVTINVGSIIIANNFRVNLRNSNQQVVSTAYHPGGSTQSISFTSAVTTGDYYLEIVAQTSANSYLTSYDFIVNYSSCVVPTVDFTYSTSGNNVTFSNLSQSAQAYTWSFGDGSNSSLANPSHSYVSTGTYTVTLTASNPCGTQSITKTVTIGGCQPVTATFTTSMNGNTVHFTNSSQNGSAYLWNFGDGGGSTQHSPSHTYLSSGTYTVSLTVANACSTQTTSSSVTIIPTAVEDLSFLQNVKLYPNPVSDYIYVESDLTPPGSDIEVLNTYGQRVLRIACSNSRVQKIDVSELLPAMYYIHAAGKRMTFIKL